MGKRKSEMHLITIMGHEADEASLTTAIDILTASRSSRFGKAQSKPRKQRSDSGKKRKPNGDSETVNAEAVNQ